jgi:hypothetical protein
MVNRTQSTKARDEYASFFCTNKCRYVIVEHSKSIVFWNNIFYMMTHQLKKFGVQIVTIDIYAQCHKMECAKDNYDSSVMGGMLS